MKKKFIIRKYQAPKITISKLSLNLLNYFEEWDSGTLITNCCKTACYTWCTDIGGPGCHNPNPICQD